MFKLISLLFISITLSGCISTPTLPQTNLQQGARIGLYVDVPETVTHLQIGTTIFNNAEKTYPYSWDFNNLVRKSVSTALQNEGFTVVELNSADLPALREKQTLIRYDEHTQQWLVEESAKSTYDTLTSKYDLAAVFVLQKKSEFFEVSLECGMHGCTSREMASPGLFSRSMFGIGHHLGAYGFEWDTYSLNPPADLMKAAPLNELFWHGFSANFSRLKDFQKPNDLDNLTEQELLYIRDLILKDIQQRTLAIVEVLKR